MKGRSNANSSDGPASRGATEQTREWSGAQVPVLDQLMFVEVRGSACSLLESHLSFEIDEISMESLLVYRVSADMPEKTEHTLEPEDEKINSDGMRGWGEQAVN
ncbi:hypothetical protein J6590_090447 [Homalodisca vitripennis]|nr:hypothetical protein J6590_090447 [Homalodisca vitripennis]